jgi:hypothetical protein
VVGSAPVKAMLRWLTFGLAILASAIPSNASEAKCVASVVAVDRCNGRMVNEYADEIRNDDARPPRSNPADLEKRFDDISQLLAGLDQERGILDIMCSTDAQKAPYFAQIGAAAAWGLALQSDVASKLAMPCPAGSKGFSQALLAQAWLDLASIVANAGGTVPPEVARIAPKVQTRAAALGLTLPAYPETSAYWRDTVAAQAKTAIEACPTPSPAPQPFSSPPTGFLRIVRK